MAANIVVTFSPTIADPLQFVIIWASRALSPGISSPPDLYFMTRAQGSAIAPISSVAFLSPWQTRFGPLVAGTKILVGIQIINTKGMRSAMSTKFVTVT